MITQNLMTQQLAIYWARQPMEQQKKLARMTERPTEQQLANI